MNKRLSTDLAPFMGILASVISEISRFSFSLVGSAMSTLGEGDLRPKKRCGNLRERSSCFPMTSSCRQNRSPSSLRHEYRAKKDRRFPPCLVRLRTAIISQSLRVALNFFFFDMHCSSSSNHRTETTKEQGGAARQYPPRRWAWQSVRSLLVEAG